MSVQLGSAFGKVSIDLSGVRSATNEFSREIGKMEVSLVSLANVARSAGLMITASIAALATSATGTAIAGLRAYQSWGEQLDMLQDIFGGTNEDAAAMAVAMNRVGLSVADGSVAFSIFARNVEQTRAELQQSTTVIAELRERISSVGENLGETRIAIAQSVFERVRGIESALAEQIESIHLSLAERLQDIAYQRAKIEYDLTKSLAKFDADTQEQLRSARTARERRELRRRRAAERAEMIERANEQKEELARQEARAIAQAERQIAIAERSAQKQIEATERAAQKQVEAAERAADKQIAAIERTIRKQNEQARLGTPMLQALDALGLKFEEIDSKPFYEQLALIMDAFKKLPEGSKAAKVALDLFGRSGIRFLDFLRSNRHEALKMAQEFGLIIDPSQAQAFSHSLNELQLRFTGLGVTIGQTVLPYAQQFIAVFKNIIDQLSPAIQNALARLATAFQTGGLQGLFDQIGREFSEIQNNPQVRAGLEQAVEWLSNALGWALTKMFAGALWVGGAIAKLLGRITDWLGTDEGRTHIQNTMNRLGTLLGNALAQFLTYTWDAGLTMAALLGRLIAWVNSADGRAWIGAATGAFASAFVSSLVTAFSNVDWGAILRAGFITSARMSINPFSILGRVFPMFAEGGPVLRTGLALVHAGEYVLSKREVDAQKRGAGIVINISHSWNGTASAYDRQAIEQIAERAAFRAVRLALDTA